MSGVDSEHFTGGPDGVVVMSGLERADPLIVVFKGGACLGKERSSVPGSYPVWQRTCHICTRTTRQERRAGGKYGDGQYQGELRIPEYAIKHN